MHPADAWTRLLRHYGHWTAFGYGPFLCFDADNTLVAEAGYADFRRGVDAHFDGVPEGMWKVDLAAQGKGYATEVMAAITSWFDTTHSPPGTVCMIDPGNEASIRVATRLGFAEFARANYRDSSVTLYERLR